jgi:anaerobic selenocysteine-containing dehydrogenase
VTGLLAQALGFNEPWLHQSVDEVITEVLAATAERYPALRGITLERLKQEHHVPLDLDSTIPFTSPSVGGTEGGPYFPTASGKVELFSQRMAESGFDALPGWADPGQVAWTEPAGESSPNETASAPLTLISAAAHHFTTSSFANQPDLLAREGMPFVEINPADAAARGIAAGDAVVVENSRGWCRLRAVVTDVVRPGVLASPKGRWSKLDGGRNVNWTVSDALADLAGQSTFHSNQVWIRRDS